MASREALRGKKKSTTSCPAGEDRRRWPSQAKQGSQISLCSNHMYSVTQQVPGCCQYPFTECGTDKTKTTKQQYSGLFAPKPLADLEAPWKTKTFINLLL